MQKNILVVEDDENIRELLIELLLSEGYSVRSAINGRDALTSISESELPDLILMDLMMPVMDGYELRRELLKNQLWSNIPTIVMSAETNAKEKLESYNISALLTKPVELDTILKTLSAFWPKIPPTHQAKTLGQDKKRIKPMK